MTELSKNNAAKTKGTITVKRPRQITILGWFFFLVSIFHFLKFIQVIWNIDLLRSLPVAVSPLYLAADGLVWGLAGLVLSRGMWKGKRWSRPAAMLLSFLYSLVFWADKIWIAEPEGLAQRWPVNLILTIIGFGMISLILSRKSSHDYFRKNPAKIP